MQHLRRFHSACWADRWLGHRLAAILRRFRRFVFEVCCSRLDRFDLSYRRSWLFLSSLETEKRIGMIVEKDDIYVFRNEGHCLPNGDRFTGGG